MDSRRTTAFVGFLIVAAACNQRIEPPASTNRTAEVQIAPVVAESTTTIVTPAAATETVQPPATATTATTVATATVDVPPAAPPGSPVIRENALPAAKSASQAPEEPASPAEKADLASTIVDPNSFANPDVRDTYAKAKLVADRLNEMYCYCKCYENPGLRHKSLLTCFQSDHAAECGICLNEGKQAYLDFTDGMPLEVTKKAIDLMYNQGNPPPIHAH